MWARERAGGGLSITEMESNMSRYKGGSRLAAQWFFKKQYVVWWIEGEREEETVCVGQKKQKEKVREKAKEKAWSGW